MMVPVSFFFLSFLSYHHLTALSKNPQKITAKQAALIASGGGHTAYALAVAQKLSEITRSPNFIIILIPSKDRWTRQKMKKYGKIIETPKAPPGSSLTKRIIAVIRGFLKALRLPTPEVVIATGSNHSLGPALAFKLKGAKLVVIEAIDRTVTKSLTVSILSKFADITALHWEIQKKNYPNGKVYGPILPTKDIKKKEDWVLATMGTEGYKEFFDYLKRNKDTLFGKERVVLQTGKVDPEEYKGVFWKVFDFDPDFEKWLAGAKLVMTHQGATAAESALVFGKPTIIVFNPNLTLTSKFEDTVTLAQLLGAELVVKFDELKDVISSVKRPKKYPNGTKALVEDILNLLHLETRKSE